MRGSRGTLIRPDARTIRKLKNFIRLYQNSKGMADKIAQARAELRGNERLLRWLQRQGKEENGI